jgi:hypothetical protein
MNMPGGFFYSHFAAQKIIEEEMKRKDIKNNLINKILEVIRKNGWKNKDILKKCFDIYYKNTSFTRTSDFCILYKKCNKNIDILKLALRNFNKPKGLIAKIIDANIHYIENNKNFIEIKETQKLGTLMGDDKRKNAEIKNLLLDSKEEKSKLTKMIDRDMDRSGLGGRFNNLYKNVMNWYSVNYKNNQIIPYLQGDGEATTIAIYYDYVNETSPYWFTNLLKHFRKKWDYVNAYPFIMGKVNSDLDKKIQILKELCKNNKIGEDYRENIENIEKFDQEIILTSIATLIVTWFRQPCLQESGARLISSDKDYSLKDFYKILIKRLFNSKD